MSGTLRRGRPATSVDNARAGTFLSSFLTLREVAELHPSIDDVFVGVSQLQTAGQASTRPLSRRKLFRILSHCEHITVAAVAELLELEANARTAQRYAGHARVASMMVTRLLDQRPWMEQATNFQTPNGAHRQSLAAARAELDAPYFAELRAAGLM